ncbi:Palmitoyltransferase [Paramecium bursaria]
MIMISQLNSQISIIHMQIIYQCEISIFMKVVIYKYQITKLSNNILKQLQYNFTLFNMKYNENSDDDDMNVELDETDVRQNIEEARKPIIMENNDQIQQIESKIQNMDEYDNVEEVSDWVRHTGEYLTFIYINDEPIFALGPQWYISVILLMISIFIEYFSFLKKTNNTIYILNIILTLLYNLSFIICSILNPGLYSSKYEVQNETTCDICQVIHYQNNITHCEQCDICIREYHHHSVIFGKCIGQGNLFYYYMFQIITPLYVINLIIILFY